MEVSIHREPDAVAKERDARGLPRRAGQLETDSIRTGPLSNISRSSVGLGNARFSGAIGFEFIMDC